VCGVCALCENKECRVCMLCEGLGGNKEREVCALCEGLGENKDSGVCDRMGESKVGDSMELEWVELVNPWNASWQCW
jgi:hypothetical protein